jgi:hypothetical protein
MGGLVGSFAHMQDDGPVAAQPVEFPDPIAFKSYGMEVVTIL